MHNQMSESNIQVAMFHMKKKRNRFPLLLEKRTLKVSLEGGR